MRGGRGRKKLFLFSSLFSLTLPFPFFGLALPRRARTPSPFPLPLKNSTMRVRSPARASALLSAAALLFLLSPFSAAAQEQLTSLDQGWTLSNGQGVSLPVSLPKYALEAMQDAGLVGDPLWR